MILVRFDGPGAFEYYLQNLPWLYGIGRVQVIETLGVSMVIAIHGATYSPRLRSSQGSNMKNRVSKFLTETEREQYEDWADAIFELAFDYPEDVCTLVYGEDFGITQNKAQRKRLADSYKDRKN
tara:strand:+ start:261 stop:632 length:372 start_codon:yes stop_codon:yes gene_type:complete